MDGSVVMPLEQADLSDLEAAGWVMPEVFCAKGRDGKTDIWGNVYRPTHFDPNRTYPVVEMIYAGPHDSHVDQDFKAEHHLISKLVELGFVVVSIDGMGTSNRSKAFHDVCWKNLKDAGFPDRIAWIKALGANSQRTEAAVRSFNNVIRSGLCGGSSPLYTYIDTYSYLMKTGYGTDRNREGWDEGIDDGLHYTTKTYKRIYKYCLNMIG